MKWIDIEKKVPRENENVLLCIYPEWIRVGRLRKGRWDIETITIQYNAVRYWTRIPKVPAYVKRD